MNRKLILNIFLCISIFSVSAQNHVIDSIRSLIKADREDTNKVNHLNDLAYAYYAIKPDTTIILAQEAASLAKRMSWNKGEANSYSTTGVGFGAKDDYPKALDYYQKALSIDKKIKNKNGIASILCNIGIAYYRTGDYTKALDYFQDALKMAEELGNKEVQAKTFQNTGNIYVEQGDYPKALDYYMNALKMAEEIGNKGLQINTIGNIGSIYYGLGDFSKALDYFLKSLKMAEEIGNIGTQENALCNIGSVYEELGDYPKALDYYQKDLTLSQPIKNKNVSTLLGNIGNVYVDQGNYPKALDYCMKALKMAEEFGDKGGIEHHLNIIGNIFFDQNDYSRALEYYSESLVICRQIDERGAIQLGNIGSIYVKQKKYILAKTYLDSALNLSKSIGTKRITKDVFGNLAQLDSAQGNFREAWENYKNYIIYRDSLINEDNTKKTVQAEMNYEFERETDSAKAEQVKLNALTAATLKNNKLLNIVAAIIIIFLLIVGFLMFNRIKLRRKLEHQLAIAAERRRISAEMHDDLGSGLAKISLLSELLKQQSKSINEALYLNNISESSKEMVDKMGNIVWALNTKYDNVENLVTYISSYAKEYFELTPIQCIVSQPDNMEGIHIDGVTRRNVFLSVKEAFHNVLKHSECTSVMVFMALDNNVLKISIQDNGKGIDLTQNSILGNGLNNMKERMNSIEGNFNILNHEGTTIELSFPVDI